MLCASTHAANTTAQSRCIVILETAPVIINDKVHLTANKTAVDANERCRGVPVDVGQRFLSDAEQRALNFDSETIEL